MNHHGVRYKMKVEGNIFTYTDNEYTHNYARFAIILISIMLSETNKIFATIVELS